MNIVRLEIRNFMSIGSGSIDFDGKGLTLIEGKNHDSPSSISNGAGKSSIFEALYWALYGKTKRYGSDGDSVINRVAGANCSVTLYFDVAGQSYRIERWRGATGSSADKNGLILEVREPSGIGYKQLTKGTMSETQKCVNDLIKMSELTFLKATCFGQGDIKPFASLSDKELKEVFEESLGLGFLSDYHAMIRAERNIIEIEAADSINHAKRLQEDLKRFIEEIKSLVSSARNFEANREKEIEQANEHVKELKSRLNALQAERPLTPSERREKEEEIQRAALALKSLQGLEERFQIAYREARDNLVRAKTEKSSKEKAVSDVAADKIMAEKKVGKPCKACGRLFAPDDISGLIEQLERISIERSKELESSNLSLAEASKKLAELDSIAEKFKEKSSELEEQKLAISSLKAEIAISNEYEERVKATRNFLARAVGSVAGIATRENMFATMAKSKSLEVRAKRAEINKYLQAAWDSNNRLSVVKLLETAFSNGGLKSYLLDNVTPRLNQLIQKNIEILDDIQVEVSTVKELKKKGQFREQFSISVENTHGAASYKGNSGGEQQKINLAIALAFNSMVREAHSDGANVLFLDEPFESLDSGSAEKVLELCKSFGGVENIFLITHNESVKELVSNVITVNKSGGIASIS